MQLSSAQWVLHVGVQRGNTQQTSPLLRDLHLAIVIYRQIMLVPSSKKPSLSSGGSISSPIAAPCKFLFSREQLVFCHIQLPDLPERISAIAHGGSYFSIFKPVESAQAMLALLIKLGSKGNDLAITQAGQRYIVWVYEADAMLASSQRVQVRDDQVTFKSATCLIFPDKQSYKFISLEIPDLKHHTPGFQYGQRYYSLLHREKDLKKAITAIAELACRGQELVLVPLPSSYAICVFEPSAHPVANRRGGSSGATSQKNM